MRLGPESAGIMMSPEEFDSIEEYDKNYRYELAYGVQVVTLYPGPEIAGPNELLGNLLFDYQEKYPGKKMFDCSLTQQYVRTKNSHWIAARLIWTGLGR